MSYFVCIFISIHSSSGFFWFKMFSCFLVEKLFFWGVVAVTSCAKQPNLAWMYGNTIITAACQGLCTKPFKKYINKNIFKKKERLRMMQICASGRGLNIIQSQRHNMTTKFSVITDTTKMLCYVTTPLLTSEWLQLQNWQWTSYQEIQGNSSQKVTTHGSPFFKMLSAQKPPTS